MSLRTNYQDDVFEGNRKYTMVTNEDQTVSLVDATTYSQEGDVFGAADFNATNTQINANTEAIQSPKRNVTLLAANWSAEGIYDVADPAITATSNQEFFPRSDINAAMLEALQNANLVGVGQEAGHAYLKAFGDVPTINIVMTMLLRGEK